MGLERAIEWYIRSAGALGVLCVCACVLVVLLGRRFRRKEQSQRDFDIGTQFYGNNLGCRFVQKLLDLFHVSFGIVVVSKLKLLVLGLG